MAKYCPKCGKENQSWNFCPDCGVKMIEKKSEPTFEEKLYQWAHNPENIKKFQEARAYFENFTRAITVDNNEFQPQNSDSTATPQASGVKIDDLSDFYYTEHPDGTVTITGVKDKNVTEATIPYNAIAIGDYAFASCENLKQINIGGRVTSIGKSAFFQCGITSIHLPGRVTTIGDSAFFYCGNLTSIYIPDSVTSIGESAFSNCSKLTSIHIPANVTSIGGNAFFRCSSLITAYIPANATNIGRDVFLGCDKLKSAYIEKGNIVGRSWSSFLSDDSIIDKLRLPFDCRIIRR